MAKQEQELYYVGQFPGGSLMALGPYHGGEIKPQLNAKAKLQADGATEVYAVRATDLQDAYATVRSHLARRK